MISDLFFKIKCLFIGQISQFESWKDEVWKVPLDDSMCCPGTSTEHPCGCGGVTHRQQLSWIYFAKNYIPKDLVKND
jgi:hypothetical protein